MQTDTALRPSHAAKFALKAVAWSLALFGLMRLRWVEAHLVLPLTRAQGVAATPLFGTPTLPVEVTLACSGADAVALCVGTILAYPARWRTRFAGASGGIALILGLNTMRIGILGHAAASPAWFNILHVYLWPAALLLAIAGYVFWWMHLADDAPLTPALERRPQPSRRFVILTAAFLVAFVALSPIYLESSHVLALAVVTARAAAAILSGVGVAAYAVSNELWTPRGGFVVTQECISTPLIPVYLAAVCSYTTTWRRLIAGVLAALPLFFALAVARLLVVAVPDVVASPLFFVHAFNQLLVGAIVICVAAAWRHGSRAAIGHAAAGMMVAILFISLMGPLYAQSLPYHGAATLNDPQGAIAFLPGFQIALYLALSVAAFAAVGWKRYAGGLAALWLTQVAGLFALYALANHSGLSAHVRDVRGWAIAGPVLIFAAVTGHARTAR